MRVDIIGHLKSCMTDIYLYIDVRTADYIHTHPYGWGTPATLAVLSLIEWNKTLQSVNVGDRSIAWRAWCGLADTTPTRRNFCCLSTAVGAQPAECSIQEFVAHQPLGVTASASRRASSASWASGGANGWPMCLAH